MLKSNSMRFAAALLAALASAVAGPNAALPAQTQHQDQAPGFYRLKVGDLEVTSLFDGTGVFGPSWLNGTISEPAWKTKPSWYLLTTDDRMIPPVAQRLMAKRASATVVEVKASHAIFVSQPQAVASVIEKAAQGVRAMATRQEE